MRLLLTTAQISKIFLGALPQDPLIYPSCLHSIDYEITTHYFALRPPYLSFLFTFNRLWDYYSLQRKYQKFSWGLYPQTPLSILPVYIQLIMRLLLTTLPPGPLIYSSFLRSIDCEITTHYSANNKNFPGALPPDPLIYPSCLQSIDHEITTCYFTPLSILPLYIQ